MDFTSSALISIIPAGIILYNAFGKRDDVDDRGIFLYLFSGFISGIFVSIFFLLLISSARNYIDLSLFLVLLFPIFTGLLNFVVFNRKKYIGNKNAIHFSFSFGAGMGTMFSLTLIYYYARSFTPSIPDYFVFLVFSFVYVLSFSSTGIIIGKGIYESRKRYNLINAFLIEMLAFLFILPYMWSMILYSIMGILIMVPIYMVLKVYLK